MKKYLFVLAIAIMPLLTLGHELNQFNDSTHYTMRQIELQNTTIKSYADSLNSLQMTSVAHEEKIKANGQSIDRWSVYLGTIVALLMGASALSGYLGNRSAKEVAFKEMREVREELETELKKIKKVRIDADQEYYSYKTMMERVKKEIKKK